MQRRQNKQTGFTLAELTLAIVILAIILVNMMELFIYTSAQSQMAGNMTQAVSQAQSKVEEMRDHSYAQIVTDYGFGGTPGNTFNLTGVTGKGTIYIDASNVELLKLTVVVNWRDKDGRIVGEDTNLNGTLDAGEDKNSNGQLDSPVILISMVTRR